MFVRRVASMTQKLQPYRTKSFTPCRSLLYGGWCMVVWYVTTTTTIPPYHSEVWYVHGGGLWYGTLQLVRR